MEGRVWALHTVICSLLFFIFFSPVLSFILTHFLVFPWRHLLFVNVKLPVFFRAEFYLASLSTKCKRVNVKGTCHFYWK